jgi:hypothetical protein
MIRGLFSTLHSVILNSSVSFRNNFATPSSIYNNSAGDYLLRYVESGAWGLQPSISGDDSSEYQGYVNSPTIDGIVLGGILVKNNNTDLIDVQSFINASNAVQIPRKSSRPASLTKRNLAQYNTEDTALATLKLLANFFDSNPPFNISPARVSYVNAAMSNGSSRV